MKNKPVMQGVCPKCGSENLEYRQLELDIISDSIYYPFICETCSFIGREWYHLVFDCFTDEDGNKID